MIRLDKYFSILVMTALEVRTMYFDCLTLSMVPASILKYFTTFLFSVDYEIIKGLGEVRIISNAFRFFIEILRAINSQCSQIEPDDYFGF